MVKYFKFNGIDTRLYDIVVSGISTFKVPKRRYNTYEVLGRNGNVVVGYDTFDNIDIEYTCFCKDVSKYELFVDKLNELEGYFKLEDNYHNDYYRIGVMVDGLDPEMMRNNKKALFTVKFNCKPQKFLVTGLEEKEITSGTYFKNTSNRDCYPIVRIYGYGTVTIGSLRITVEDYSNYIEIDGETLKFDKDGAIDKVSFNAYQRIKLVPGNTRISYSLTEHSTGSGAKVVIIPRWYRI